MQLKFDSISYNFNMNMQTFQNKHLTWV